MTNEFSAFLFLLPCLLALTFLENTVVETMLIQSPLDNVNPSISLLQSIYISPSPDFYTQK